MRAVLFTMVARDQLQRELSAFGETRVVENPQELMASIAGADVLVMGAPATYTESFAAELCAKGKSLRWLQFLSAGVDGPLLHGIPAGAILTNGGDSWSPNVAEHGVALLLALLRRIPDCVSSQADCHWNPQIRPRLDSIEGKTITILGFGSIGRELAARLLSFGSNVIGINRSGKGGSLSADVEMVSMAGLSEVLGRTDVLIVTVPLTLETRHLVGEDTLQRMKRGGLLVNLSRGGTVDPSALAEALEDGRLQGAALDVTEPEPLPADHPLWGAPNILISPHIAGFGGDRLGERLVRLVAENAKRFAGGLPLLHQIQAPARD